MSTAALLALTLVAQYIPVDPAPKTKPPAPEPAPKSEPAPEPAPEAPVNEAATRPPVEPEVTEAPEIDAAAAGVAAGAGFFAPGAGSYMRGDVAGGLLQTTWGLQGLGFFVPALVDKVAYDEWSSDRRYVAIVSGAAVFAVSYFAGIVRAGRPVPTTGSPRDPLRVRLGITTFSGPRMKELDDHDEDFVPIVGQRIRVGVMIGPGLEFAVTANATFGELEESEDLGLSFTSDLTGYIPTGTRVSPYLGLGGGFHPESPLLIARSGLVVALSSTVDLQLGMQSAIASEGGADLAYVQGDIGFVQAF